MSQKNRKYNIPPSFQAILEKDELSTYEDYFNTEATKEIRRKLVELFEKKIAGSYLKSDKEVKYELPSWAEYQADAIGYRRSLKELINFLK